MAEADRWLGTIVALHQAAVLVLEAWHTAVTSSALSPGQQQVYLRGFTDQSIQVPGREGPLSATISNTSRGARSLENDRPAYHLPERVHWGQTPGSRRSKQGRWYLRIPFTHRATRSRSQAGAGLPGLPAALYRVARRLEPGQRLTAGPSSGRAVHAPGMTPYVPRYARNIRLGYTHASRYEGLRRVQQRRGRRSVQYLTFRTMTQNSPGWWIPPRRGVQLAPQVQRATSPAVRELLSAGVQADVDRVLRQTLGGGG